MSIIQEALKKAQPKTPQFPSSVSDKPTMHEAISPKIVPATSHHVSHPPRKPLPFIVGASVIGVIAFACTVYFLGTHNNIAPLPVAQNPPTNIPHQDVSYKPLQAPDAVQYNEPASQSSVTPQSVVRVKAPPTLVLNGIMYIADNPRAIINGSVVKVGDVVSDARVARIDESAVLLTYNDIEINLKLK